MKLTLPHATLLRPAGGFTLVEIMVVVVIIGILAALAIPAFMHMQRAAQNNRFLNDLRAFSQAFETYALQNGAWPPNAGAGVVPTGMASDFRAGAWQATTPVGGRWNWDNNINGYRAAISVSSPTADDSQLAEIDAKIDDGDLTTGMFVKASNRFMYILEK